MNNMLVIGSSHAGFFKRCVEKYFSYSGAPSFDVIAVHGLAFYTNDSIEILANKNIRFHDVNVDQIDCKWYTNIKEFRKQRNSSINPCDYEAIFLLDPLFLGAQVFREKLLLRNYICSSIDIKFRKHLMDRFPGNFHLISRAQFLECYKHFMVVNLKLLQYFYNESIADKVYLVPHVLPPLRHELFEWGAYNIGEQMLISEFALKEFSIKTLPSPEDAIVETENGFTCLEEYHEPHPDPHHATPLYYKRILDAFLGASSA